MPTSHVSNRKYRSNSIFGPELLPISTRRPSSIPTLRPTSLHFPSLQDFQTKINEICLPPMCPAESTVQTEFLAPSSCPFPPYVHHRSLLYGRPPSISRSFKMFRPKSDFKIRKSDFKIRKSDFKIRSSDFKIRFL